MVKDHPDWWVYVTLDGFGSHINVFEAMGVFLKHKIELVKEEADTSHVNQV